LLLLDSTILNLGAFFNGKLREDKTLLPYQFVKVLVIHLGSLVCEITTHCDNDIVGAVVLGLGLGEIQKRIDLMWWGTQTSK